MFVKSLTPDSDSGAAHARRDRRVLPCCPTRQASKQAKTRESEVVFGVSSQPCFSFWSFSAQQGQPSGTAEPPRTKPVGDFLACQPRAAGARTFARRGARTLPCLLTS